MQRFIVILLLFTLFSCTNKSQNIIENGDMSDIDSSQNEENEIQDEIIGFCITDNLRIREMPFLDSPKIGSLIEDEKVIILSKTNWTENIDNIENHWFEINYSDNQYWVFGGYISTESENIPINGKINQKIKTQFSNSEGNISLEQFNDIAIPHVSIYPEFDYSEPENQRIEISDDYLYLINSPEPVYKVLIDILSPENIQFQKLYKSTEINQILKNPYEGYGELPNIALFFPFNKNASFSSGLWEIKIEIDDDFVISQKIDISMDYMTISETEEIDVFSETKRISADYGDEIFVYLNPLHIQEKYFIAIYGESKEEIGTTTYSARYATELISDSNGKIKTSIILGKELEPAIYKIAYGKSKDDMNVFLYSNEVIIK
jgi:hypothetical protein